MSNEFRTFIDEERDSILWFRAFFDWRNEREKTILEAREFQEELLNAAVWQGNMTAHFGTMVSSFLSKDKKNIGQVYMPKKWKERLERIDSNEVRKKEGDQVAESLAYL